MLKKRFELDGLELLLLSTLLKIEVGIKKKDEDLNKRDLNRIAFYLGRDWTTIKKFFNLSDKLADRNDTSTPNPSTMDKIIKRVKPVNCNTWEEFREKFITKLPYKYPRISPKHIISESKKQEIEDYIDNVLSIVYGNNKPDLSVYFSTYKNDNIDYEVSEKLKKYLNSTWHIYFFFPLNPPKGEIIRTVLQIGSTPNDVHTYSPRNHIGGDDFTGTVRFNTEENILKYDLKTESGKRAPHILQLINSMEDLQKITLAEYHNSGLAGSGLHSIRAIMQYMGDSNLNIKDKKHLPTTINVGSPEFSKIPLAFKQFLRYEKNNYRILDGTPPIFSLKDLEQFVKTEEEDRFKQDYLRLHEKFQVIFSFPRYPDCVSEEEFEHYRKVLTELKAEMEQALPFEIDDYYLSRPQPHSYPRYRFYSDRIRESDIVIAFLFHKNASMSACELSIACETGKKVVIYAKNDKDYLPVLFRGDYETHVTIRDDFNTFEEAISEFKDNFKHHFKAQITENKNLGLGNDD